MAADPKKGKRKTKADAAQAAENRYMRSRTVLGLALLACVIVVSLAVIAVQRVRLSNAQLYATNRVRIQTVLGGLESGGTEKAELEAEYDRLYTAKLKNTQHYYNSFAGVTVDNDFVRDAARFAEVTGAAVVNDAGHTLAAWQCPYDFTRNRFNMLRACDGEDGFSTPFSIAYDSGTVRFFAKRMAADRILVFVQDWAATETNIANMTSWEAVLRGMVSVDTVSVAVSLQDYTFLYNPIDDLTGKDALHNGVPIDCLGNDYEGELTFGGDTWCVVGRPWNDAQVFVMTRKSTDMANDVVLLFFISALFLIFAGLVSIYGIIINRDNIRLDKAPAYLPLLTTRGADGKEKHIFNFNLTVAGKLLPLALTGIAVVTGMSFYLQSVNGLASIAYESNRAISEIGNKLANNSADAEAVNTEYKQMFLSKCRQIAGILEENPAYVFDYDPEAENVHTHPVERNADGTPLHGFDEYGNVCYSVSEQPFLSRLCELNAIENISVFDEQGRIMATNGDDWYFVLAETAEDGTSYPFREILLEHRDILTEDLAENENGEMSQYIGSAFYYYTVPNADGSTGFVTRDDYAAQLAGTWQGAPVTKHRGAVQINIAPERLRTVMETATLPYVAGNTTIHGTGHTVILDNSADHICLYSPRSADIGKTAAAMGYSPAAFNASGEMYNGFETVNGVEYFQTFKLVDEYDYYIGTAVPLSTVFATRSSMTLITLWVSAYSLLIIFLYTCCFGEDEEELYHNNERQAEWRLRNDQELFTMTMPSGKTRRVRTAASRWDAEYIPWPNKTPEQKFGTVLRAVFYLFAGLLFLCILLSRSGIFPINAIDYVYESVWPKGFNIFAMTNCAITLIVVVVVANLAEAVIENLCASLGSRAETLAHLITSVLHYGVAIFAVFYTLYLCGLDTGSLIASAGILSLIVGLGSQSMIQDILAGVFIVFEGSFRVGDIVTIDNFRGTVLEIGLRTTKIQDGAKNVKVFSNSSLTGIINMTKEATFASIDVGVAYGTDPVRLEEIFAEELPKIGKKLPAILDGPHYKGVSMLNASSVDLKIVAQCKEQNRIQLCRDLNREIFLLLKKYGVDIPFPQVTVSYLDEGTPAPADGTDLSAGEKEQSHDEAPVS